jgi:hypothetical protein
MFNVSFRSARSDSSKETGETNNVRHQQSSGQNSTDEGIQESHRGCDSSSCGSEKTAHSLMDTLWQNKRMIFHAGIISAIKGAKDKGQDNSNIATSIEDQVRALNIANGLPADTGLWKPEDAKKYQSPDIMNYQFGSTGYTTSDVIKRIASESFEEDRNHIVTEPRLANFKKTIDDIDKNEKATDGERAIAKIAKKGYQSYTLGRFNPINRKHYSRNITQLLRGFVYSLASASDGGFASAVAKSCVNGYNCETSREPSEFPRGPIPSVSTGELNPPYSKSCFNEGFNIIIESEHATKQEKKLAKLGLERSNDAQIKDDYEAASVAYAFMKTISEQPVGSLDEIIEKTFKAALDESKSTHIAQLYFTKDWDNFGG